MTKKTYLTITFFLLFLATLTSLRFRSFLGFGISENLCREIEENLTKKCADVDKFGYLLEAWPAFILPTFGALFFASIGVLGLINFWFTSVDDYDHDKGNDAE